MVKKINRTCPFARPQAKKVLPMRFGKTGVNSAKLSQAAQWFVQDIKQLSNGDTALLDITIAEDKQADDIDIDLIKDPVWPEK